MKTPKKCSRCKLLVYCSPICQLEHYNKTHKNHCKYLAGIKVKEGSIHTKKNCPRCISTKRLPVEELMDPLSSIYPCIFGPGGLTGEEKRNKLTGQKQMTLCNGGFLPFELGEITGKFNHPLEQCLSILAHMCMKLTYTTPEAYDQLWAVAEKLSHMRTDAWNNWIQAVNMDVFPQTFRETSKELFNKIRLICRDYCQKKEVMEGIDWWMTLSLFVEVTCDLASCLLAGNRFREECSASLQPILDLVTKEMPAYDDIIRAMCNEKVERVCEGCNEEMVVRAFCAQTDWLDEKRDFGVITIGPRGIKLSCTQCVEKVHKEDLRLVDEPFLNVGSRRIVCHYCWRFCTGRPRCEGCQSKVYCSVECRHADWDIHEMFCEQIQEASRNGENGRYMSKRAVDRADSSSTATTKRLRAKRLERKANWSLREADELEQQMEKDTAMLESLQIEKREKMNKKKEAEIKLEKEKRRLEKLDSKCLSVFKCLFVKATVTSRRVSNFFGNLLIKEMMIVLLSPGWARPDVLPHQFDQ